MNFNQFKTICLSATGAFVFLMTQSLLAIEYGQIVRIKCDRTGNYLSYNPNNDPSGTRKIILSPEANENSLWIVKGPLNAPVSGTNPYNRWNCTFGGSTTTNNYDARLEHLVTGSDAHFGDYYPAAASAGRIYPYNYNVGQGKIGDSSAIHYYNAVLNLHGGSKILVSNEYLCEYDTGEAILTQDPVVDTWNIIPVYTMTEEQKSLQGNDLLAAVQGSTTPPQNPAEHASEQIVADQLIQDVSALINFYENEISYNQAIQTAFAALINEPDINQRISILQNLDANTTDYNNAIASILATIPHLSASDLITHINALLIESKSIITTLQSQLEDINRSLSEAGAISVPDLRSKIDQLVAELNDLWK